VRKVHKVGWSLGFLLLIERIWKLSMVNRFFQRPLPVMKKSPELVSIIQPVLSGDPTMSDCLECTLQLKSVCQIEIIWLVDREDTEGQRICLELIEKYPSCRVQLITVPQPPRGYNPKIFKLIEGRKVAHGDVLCVLDDDTMLPTDALDMALPFLDQPDVGLAFGLPYYVNFSNIWSSMVSAFVNSNSLLSYIPYISIINPFTINGMFYILRSDVLDEMGGFDVIKHMFADDFAIAHLCRTHGYKLAQTPVCHSISTQVRNAKHYISLLLRWFVFPRESILRHVSWFEQVIFYMIGMVPVLFPLFLVLLLLFRPSWSKCIYTLLYFGCSIRIIDYLNKSYLRSATPAHKKWWIPVMLVLIPVQILIALISPQRVNWRGNIVQVERGGGFVYLQRRIRP
jgi:ceramide glucosyltransferase